MISFFFNWLTFVAFRQLYSDVLNFASSTIVTLWLLFIWIPVSCRVDCSCSSEYHHNNILYRNDFNINNSTGRLFLSIHFIFSIKTIIIENYRHLSNGKIDFSLNKELIIQSSVCQKKIKNDSNSSVQDSKSTVRHSKQTKPVSLICLQE